MFKLTRAFSKILVPHPFANNVLKPCVYVSGFCFFAATLRTVC